MNILFLCTANENRSRTAEFYFQQQYQLCSIRSAGLNARLCRRIGSRLCTNELLDWADHVFVMEEHHKVRIQRYSGDNHLDKIKVLDIEDKYKFMQDDLVKKLITATHEFFQNL